MEQWEIDLRARLEEEVPDGFHLLDDGEDGWVLGTGKQGKINYLVEVERGMRGCMSGLEKDADDSTSEDFVTLMNQLKKAAKNFNPKDDGQ